MYFVAFFRNLNLGRTRCPTREQFEAAFLEAGAETAASFLTNGTLAFQANHQRHAKQIAVAASESMVLTCGLQEPCFLRSLAQLKALVASDPFVLIDRSTVYDCYVTFLSDRVSLPKDMPMQSTRGDVEIVRCTKTEALCIARKLTKTAGSPNAFLERTLGSPTTTRAWNTIVRIAAKYS